MESNTGLSLLLPSFLCKLSNPNIKTVFLSGCGGGFDFCHSMSLYPELKRLGKKIVIGSYSFGNPHYITGEVKKIFEENNALVVEVSSKSIPDKGYGPEVLMCQYLDQEYPEDAPHTIYAYYARSFTPDMLTGLYSSFVKKHDIDAFVLFDGGTDSLMAGDEEGLGDPIEDCVSITAVASLDVKLKLLISVGLGADRFNHVSDAASLRAIAELTAMGGFLGSCSIEPSSVGFNFYKKGIQYMYSKQTFRSVLTSLILTSARGVYGFEIPDDCGNRVKKGNAFLWPLMAILWAFDVETVVKRSMISKWIKECKTVPELHYALNKGRTELLKNKKIRDIEDLPLHASMMC